MKGIPIERERATLRHCYLLQDSLDEAAFLTETLRKSQEEEADGQNETFDGSLSAEFSLLSEMSPMGEGMNATAELKAEVELLTQSLTAAESANQTLRQKHTEIEAGLKEARAHVTKLESDLIVVERAKESELKTLVGEAKAAKTIVETEAHTTIASLQRRLAAAEEDTKRVHARLEAAQQEHDTTVQEYEEENQK